MLARQREQLEDEAAALQREIDDMVRLRYITSSIFYSLISMP